MKKNNVAKELISLKINANRISWGETGAKGKFSQKLDILFLIGECEMHSPRNIMRELVMAKSNVALICNSLCASGYLVKRNAGTNKKEIGYYITKSGSQYLSSRLEDIEKMLGNISADTLEKVNEKLWGVN